MNKQLPYKSNKHYWWIAIIALSASVATICFIQPDPFNPDTQKLRVLVPAAGIIVAGFCLITATADRWFR